MKQSLALLAACIAVLGSSLAGAQQTLPPQIPPAPETAKPSKETSPSPTPAPQPPPPTATTSTTPNSAIVINVPNPVKIETIPAGSSGGSLSGVLTFLAGIVVALIGGAISLKQGYLAVGTAQKAREAASDLAEREGNLRMHLAEREGDLRIELAEMDLEIKRKDLEEKQRQAKEIARITELAEKNKTKFEQDRNSIELERLGFQSGGADREAYMAATRFVHEQQLAEISLLESYSSRLTSGSERDRSFALFALSAYISPKVIGRLAIGGIISMEDLEKLTMIDDQKIVAAAKSAIQQQKISRGSSIPSPPAGR